MCGATAAVSGAAKTAPPARALDLRDRLDPAQKVRRDRLVHRHEGDGVLPGPVAAEVEGRDVDPGLAEQRAEAADEARLVEVVHVEHVGRERGVELHALDLDDARRAGLDTVPAKGAPFLGRRP